MCRNIRTLYNFQPPATDDEARAAKRFGAALFVLLVGAPMMVACDRPPEELPAPPAGATAFAPGDTAAGPGGSSVENVETEVDVSAVGACNGRIFIGVRDSVREVRPEDPFIMQAVELLISANISITRISAFACEGEYLYALVDVGGSDPAGWSPAIASIRLQASGGFGNWKLTGLPKTSDLTYAGDIESAGGRLWVTTSDPGYFRVFDLQTPDAPREIGSLELPVGYTASGWSPMLSIGDGLAFIATGTGVLVIDLFEPEAPKLLAEIDAPGDPMGEAAGSAPAYATDVVAEGRSALAAGPDGVWTVVQEEGLGEWRAGGVIAFAEGQRRFIGRHDGHPGIERTMPSNTGEVWAAVYEEIDLRLPEAPVLFAAAGLPNGYARRLVLIGERLFAIRHDGSVERVASEKLTTVDPHVE